MRIAYLIDRDSIGGGMEYIRRQIAAHPYDECRIFFSERGECTMRQMDGWGADEIWVVHLRALLQLLGNPLVRIRVPVVFAALGVHIRKYDFLPRTPLNRVLRLERKLLERYLYRRCSRIVVQNAADADKIQELYGEKLMIELDRPSLGDWKPPDQSHPVPDGPGSGAFVYIARFEFQKGQDRWLRYVSSRQDDFRAQGRMTVFVGSGSELEACKRFVADEGLGDLVRFDGETADIEPYLRRAYAVVSASRWEGHPFLLMKARALGCRILATDCPGNSDVLAGYEKWERLEL